MSKKAKVVTVYFAHSLSLPPFTLTIRLNYFLVDISSLLNNKTETVAMNPSKLL